MSSRNIFGRRQEQVLLKEIWGSKEAEFLAVYGRRRVGKTFLIREYFSKKGIYFELTGQKEGSLSSQLHNFSLIYCRVFGTTLRLDQVPKSWKEAFELLVGQIESLPKTKKIILFFDEMPWLATRRSGFLQALDYYWNRHFSGCKNVVLIGCGSAASWMLDHLINAKGGLHNRLTRIIKLEPFSIQSAYDYLTHRGFRLSPRQLCDFYMVFGGIPYYLKQLLKSKSAAQNINNMCFKKDGVLFSEFDRLFHSLFEQPEFYLKIVRAIASKRGGISREELLSALKLKSGGNMNRYLEALEAAGFVQSYIPYGNKKKAKYFRVIDEFTLFYLHWIEPVKNRGTPPSKNYWKTKMTTPAGDVWAGLAFEAICLKHVDLLLNALDLEGIHCEVGTFRYIPKSGIQKDGAQVDLLFDRDDGIVTLCEMKYAHQKFVVTKSYAQNLMKKIQLFGDHYKGKKQLNLVLVTIHGHKNNIWSEDLLDGSVCLAEYL